MNHRRRHKKLFSIRPCLTQLALFALAVMLGGVGSAGPAAAQEAAKEIWHLKQKHCDKGALDLYIGSNCVKITSPSGYVFLVKAPDWTVHCFRPALKEEWSAPLELFNGLQMANPMELGYPSKTHLKAFGKGKIKGLTYISFTTLRPSRTTMVASNQIKTDDHVIDFIARLYYIPNPGLVPLYYYEDKRSQPLPDGKSPIRSVDLGDDFRSGMIKQVDFDSFTKEPYRQLDFALPVKFSRRKNLAQIIFTGDQKAEINEALNGIGFIADIKKQGKATSQSSKNTQK